LTATEPRFKHFATLAKETSRALSGFVPLLPRRAAGRHSGGPASRGDSGGDSGPDGGFPRAEAHTFRGTGDERAWTPRFVRSATMSILSYFSCCRKRKTSVDDLPDILQKLVIAKKPKQVKQALNLLLAVADEAIVPVAVVRSGKIVPKLHTWAQSRDAVLRRTALICAATLSQASETSGCAEALATSDFLMSCGAIAKQKKDKRLVRVAARYFAAAGGNQNVRVKIVDASIHDQVWSFVKSKDAETMKFGILAYGKFADDAYCAKQMCQENLTVEDLVKFFFARITKTDDTDVENWCLMAVARLAQAPLFSNKLAKMDKLPIIFAKANDSIAGRKLAAALCVANCAANKTLRVRLVKHRAYQLFVEMSKVGSHARRDMQDFQRVAALGFRNLCSNFHLRALAGRVGAVEAVVRMLRSRDQDIRRYAAKAAAELSLHEENGKKMVDFGAFTPLIALAKSGDRYCEDEAVTALANLALTEENQSEFQKEGGMEAMEIMALSRNPKVVKIAKRLTMRVRMTKLRTAARFAGKMAAVQKDELIKKGEWNEDGDKDAFSGA